MKTIQIHCPDRPRLRYAVDIVVRHILGANIEWATPLAAAATDVVLRAGAGSITVPTTPLTQSGAAIHQELDEQIWRKPPWLTIRDTQVPAFGVPVGTTLPWASHGATLHINFPLFDAAWILLSGQADGSSVDEHGRSCSREHLLVQHNCEMVPVVDLYAVLIEDALQRVAPGFEASVAQHSSPPLVTHDVDRPWEHDVTGTAHRLRRSAANLLRDRDPELAFGRVLSMMRRTDVMDTFDFICTALERFDLCGAFNFFGGGNHPLDATYRLGDPRIDALLCTLHKRGHQLGYHASYACLDTPDLIQTEFSFLRDHCERLGIVQNEWGGRHHYLRWRPDMWPAWDEAGLTFDSSVGFPDRTGYRLGTGHPVPVYDIASERTLDLVEVPLLLMEVAVLEYERSSLDELLTRVERLRNQSLITGGRVVILWHNDRLVHRRARQTYLKMLEILSARP